MIAKCAALVTSMPGCTVFEDAKKGQLDFFFLNEAQSCKSKEKGGVASLIHFYGGISVNAKVKQEFPQMSCFVVPLHIIIYCCVCVCVCCTSH